MSIIILFAFAVFSRLVLLDSTSSGSCFLKSAKGDCLLCPFDSFHPGVLLKSDNEFFYNDSKSTLKPCQLKTAPQEAIKRTIFLSSSSSCDECLGVAAVNKTYFDLITALTEESLILAEFLYSELTILLVGREAHFILPSQLEDRKGISFFRRQNLKINIEPLACSSMNIKGCFEENLMAELVLKSSEFSFYIANSFVMKNIRVSGSDLFLGGSSSGFRDCLNSKSACCDEEKKLLGRNISVAGLDGACRLSGMPFVGASDSEFQNTFALLNLETFTDDANAPKPTLSLINCIFENMQLLLTSGFLSVVRAANPGMMLITFTELVLKRCFFPYGVFWVQSRNSEEVFEILGVVANTTILEYNIFPINFEEKAKSALFYFKNVLLSLNVSNLTISKAKPNSAFHFLILVENDEENSKSRFFFKCLHSSESDYFALLSLQAISGKIEELYLQKLKISSKLISLARTQVSFKDLKFDQVTGRVNEEGLQSVLMLSESSQIFIDGLSLLFCASTEIIFKNGLLSIETFRIVNVTFSGALFTMPQMVCLLNNGLVESPSGNSFIFDIQTGHFNISNALFNNLKVPYPFNPNLVDFFLARHSKFTNSSLLYITAPSRVYKKLTFENCTFSDIQFQIFFSFYISSPYPNLLLFTGCTFVDLKILSIFFELCCTDFEISNTSFKRVIMDEVQGVYMITMESAGNYAIKNCEFYNFGFNNINKIDWLQVSYGYYTGAYLWYGDSLTVKNVYCELDAEFFFTAGFLAAESATYYAYVDNYTIISKARGDLRFVKGFYCYKVSNFTLINSNLSGLGCTGMKNPVTFSLDNGAVGMVNNPYFGGDDKNEFYARLENVTFSHSSCRFGGAFSLVNYNNIFLENVTIRHASSLLRGGGIMIFSSRNARIRNLFIEDAESYEGSFMYLESITSCTMNNVTLKSGRGTLTGGVHLQKIKHATLDRFVSDLAYAQESGGVLYLEEAVFLLSNSLLTSSKARTGAFIYAGSLATLLIQNMTAEGGQALGDAGFLFGGDVADLSLNHVALKSLKSSASSSALRIITFKSLNIANLSISVAETEGKATILIKSSSDKSLILVDDLLCSETIADQGTCLFIDMISPVKVNRLRAERNFGVSIIHLSYSSITVTDFSSFAVTDSEVDHVLQGEMANLRITDFNISECLIHKSFFFVQESELALGKIKIENQKSSILERSPSTVFLFPQCSRIELKYLQISINSANAANVLSVLGGSIWVSHAVIQNSKFSDAIFTIVNSPLTVFFNATVADSEAPATFNLTKTDVILEEVKILRSGSFVLKSTSESLQPKLNVDFWAYGGTSASVTFLKCVFTNGEGTAVQLLYVANFICRDSLFIGADAKGLGTDAKGLGTDAKGLGTDAKGFGTQFLLLQETPLVKIFGTLFNNSYSRKGSALSFTNFLRASSSIFLSKSIFSYGKAFVGGAIYFEGLVNFSVDNCTFEKNQALLDTGGSTISGIAGALYFNCSETKKCSGYLSGNIFRQNQADSFGAAIFSEYFITQSKDKKNTFVENFDEMKYSDDLGSIAECVIILNETLTSESDDGCVSLSTLLEIDSGTPFDLQVALTDYYGRIISYDNRSTITMKSVDSALYIFYPQESPAVLEGKKSFTQVSIKMTPELSADLLFELELYYPGSSVPVLESHKLRVKSKPCLPGSIIKFDMSCEPCEAGTYSWEDPMKALKKKSMIQCRKCPSNFICPGKDRIYPDRGFWRFSDSSLVAIKCRNPEACRGYDINPDGQYVNQPCLTAHYGNICHECIAGHGKFTKGGLCENCDKDRPLYLVRLILTIIAVLFYVILNTYIFTKQVKSSSMKREVTTSPFIVFKILFNHLQSMATLSVNFDYSSFPFFESFINLQSYFSILNEDVISVECIMQSIYSKDYTYVIKIFGLIVLPVGIGIVAFFFWFSLLGIFVVFRLRFSRSVKSTLKKILVSFTIAAYLLYPIIIQAVFSLSNCMSLNTGDGQRNYLYLSPNILCWEGTHWILFLSLFLPSSIIWGIAFPLFLYFILRMSYLNDKRREDTVVNQENLKKMSLSKSLQEGNIFRFFYEDYKSSCFYWEIVIFTKKFLLNILISCTELLGTDLNTVLKISLLVIYAILVLRIRPFYLHSCNNFEISSNIIVIASINLVFISIDDAVKNYAMPFLILILIINIIWIFMLLLFFFKLAYLKKKDYDAKRRTMRLNSSKSITEDLSPSRAAKQQKTQVVKIKKKR